MIPNNITKTHLEQAIAEIDAEGIRKGRHSSTYDLIYQDQAYPPKLVISIANRYANGEELDPSEFGGGKETAAFQLLEKAGFEIKAKRDSLRQLVEGYKVRIAEVGLAEEVYKWEIVEQYRGRPNTSAADFLTELKSIKFKNLIYHMAPRVLYHIASEKPEELRQTFIALYDEKQNLTKRIKAFRKDTLVLYRAIGQTEGHHQDERSIATYLTLQYPEKYTFYKASFYNKFCQLLDVKKAKTTEKYTHYLELLENFIENYIATDQELISQVKSLIPDYYDGNNHLLLAQDILFQMLESAPKKANKETVEGPKYWLYAPGENASRWDEFHQQGIMALDWDELGDLQELGDKKDITAAIKNQYQTETNPINNAKACFQFRDVVSVGDIIIPKKGRQEYLGYGIVTSDYFFDDTRDQYWHCREVEWKKKGSWAVKEEKIVLKTLTDITLYPEYVQELIQRIGIENTPSLPPPAERMNFPLNTILYGPPGTGKTYNTVKRAAEIIANRIIDNYDEALKIFKDKLHDQIEFITFHQNYSYEDFIQGLRPDTENNSELTFTKRDGVFKLLAKKALSNLEASEKPQALKQEFGKVFEQFLFPLVEGEVEELEVKMKKVSYFITNTTDKSIEFRKDSGESVHTLSIATLERMYEAESTLNIQGLAPYYGPLLDILLRMGKDSSGKTKLVERKNFVIIIDEINRANISRVFGELITLIEPDKRSHGKLALKVILPSGDQFTVPSNLYIIGTMNTADKSIALLDIALRRRFEFEAMYPDYTLAGIYDIDILQKINEQIIKTKGYDFQVGHAYFMGEDNNLITRMNKKVIPLLLEYYMNDEQEVKKILKSAGLKLKDGAWPLQIQIEGKDD